MSATLTSWFNRSTAGFQDTFGVLQDPTYRWYWLSLYGYYLGTRMEEMVRGYLTYTMTESAVSLGLVLASMGVSHALIGMVGGTLADRIAKRTMVMGAQVVLAATSGTLLFLVTTGMIEYWHVVVTATIHGITLGLSMPSRLAYVAEIAKPEEFVRAYGLYYVALNTMRIGGPALGGILVVWIGMQGAYAVITAAYIWGFIAMLRVNPTAKPPEPSGKSFLHDLLEAFRFARRTPFIMIMMSTEVSKVLCVSPSRQLLPVFAVSVFMVGAGGLGTMMAAIGAGAIIGSVLVALAGGLKRKVLGLLIIGACEGAVLMGFAATNWFIVACGFIGMFGVFSAIYTTLESTLFQLSSTPEMRGRVMGLRSLASAMEPLGLIPLTFIADAIGVQTAVLIAGGATILLMLVTGLVFPNFRQTESLGMAPGGARH